MAFVALEQRQLVVVSCYSPNFLLRTDSMDHQSISIKIARLRAELHEIGVANRKYFEKKRHSEEERTTHLRIQERIREIKAELETMLEEKRQTQ